MKSYQSLTREEREAERSALMLQYEEAKKKGYKLDMSRGKPAPDQLRDSHIAVMIFLLSECIDAVPAHERFHLRYFDDSLLEHLTETSSVEEIDPVPTAQFGIAEGILSLRQQIPRDTLPLSERVLSSSKPMIAYCPFVFSWAWHQSAATLKESFP